ncbi:hypothetical protein M1M25_gp114 [Tenacibaculum phage Gundel_1]|uniref:Uncharacterized protein n=1 Tax=Tenacibaculum phage Gundel_1 TaxID=2745672 RepID=A0A8E4ZL12_9CAUD|nr:hypothetical protein M1M25_gp114 [Tenacibaculum phage Gundel_1]QQV91426.1 hypothetical protein Gundel1_104 [Tenacibaculum phage Gundel_1]
MYKEIFKSGLNDKSLAAAGEYALVKVMYGVNHREKIRQIFELYNEKGIILKESNEKSDVLEYFKKPNNTYDLIKESLKIKPIVKVPTAELHIIHKDGSIDIKHYPTKSDSYDGSKINNLYINDEVGHWSDPKLANLPSFGVGWTANPKYVSGIDPYDINDEESKGSLKYK